MATSVKTITVRFGTNVTDTNDFTKATNSQTDKPEEFEAEIEAADGKWYFDIDNSAGDGVVYVSVAGNMGTRLIGLVRTNSRGVMVADSSACLADNGKMRIAIAPTPGKSLADMGVKVQAVQFIPVECK